MRTRRPMYLSAPGISPTRTAEHVATRIAYDLTRDGWVIIPLGDVIRFRECGHVADKPGRHRCFQCKGVSA